MRSRTLAALTASALAIPGAQAGSPPAETQLDYQFHRYRENELDGRERYAVDSHLFRAAGAASDRVGLALDLGYETMSGASPWFVTPGARGPVQVMSGASIEDRRGDLLGQASFYGDDGRVGLQLGVSAERDYRAGNVGLDGELELNQGNTVLAAGLGHSNDHIEPYEGGSRRFPERIERAARASLTAFAGLTQTLDPNTVAQAALSYDEQTGFLADPYKLAYVADNLVADSRPRARRQWSLLGRLRRYVAALGGAWHLDYRHARDDWDVVSHTVETAWHQTLAQGWQWAPALRWYSQSEAYFHRPYYEVARADGVHSSDHRLSGFGAISLRVDLSYTTPQWEIGLGAEHYDSDRRYALRPGAIESPGLVDFTILSLRYTRRG